MSAAAAAAAELGFGRTPGRPSGEDGHSIAEDGRDGCMSAGGESSTTWLLLPLLLLLLLL